IASAVDRRRQLVRNQKAEGSNCVHLSIGALLLSIGTGLPELLIFGLVPSVDRVTPTVDKQSLDRTGCSLTVCIYRQVLACCRQRSLFSLLSSLATPPELHHHRQDAVVGTLPELHRCCRSSTSSPPGFLVGRPPVRLACIAIPSSVVIGDATDITCARPPPTTTALAAHTHAGAHRLTPSMPTQLLQRNLADLHPSDMKDLLLKHFQKLYEGYVPMSYKGYLKKMKSLGVV
ncbi:hypothetical protein Taro_012994, partial [Colocasia esculenta]|nr:hypothetical protein [Colocasia esculenta]